MPRQGDRVQREIEELLDQLDNFVPEERLITKIKNKRRQEQGPGLPGRAWNAAKRPFTRIKLSHVMLLGIALILTSWLAPGLYGDYARLAAISGIVLTGICFLLSLMGWDSRRTIAGGRVERRWRGQVIEYDEPSRRNPLRDWFRSRRRR
jgi:hypothetical protein